MLENEIVLEAVSYSEHSCQILSQITFLKLYHYIALKNIFQLFNQLIMFWLLIILKAYKINSTKFI